MIYMRGQAADYDHWRDLGNPGWGWGDVLPYFLRHEDHHAGATDLHGAGGEWRVERQRLSWEILDAFRDAAAQTGIPAVDDFNRGDNHGCGYFEVNQRRGARWSAAKGFLHPVRSRPNLTVLTGATALRVRFDGRRALGVEYRRDDAVRFAAANVETLLSAGAVHTPVLLQRSGVGPGPLLQRHGITPVQLLPGVGANLQDHLQLRMVFRVQGVSTLNTRVRHWWGKVGMALQYALAKRGPLTMSPSQLGAFARSATHVATPDLEYHVQPLSLDKFGDPLHNFPAFTASVCHLRPRSRGTVELGGPDPAAPPHIQPNYLSHAEDRQVAVAALRLTRRIAATPALARYAPQEHRPGAALQTDDELIQAAGDIGTTIFHPVGTCRMGDDPLAVVDHRLRLRGLDRLRVVDASVMPTITSGNTNSPTLMIAEKAAAMIWEDRTATR